MKLTISLPIKRIDRSAHHLVTDELRMQLLVQRVQHLIERTLIHGEHKLTLEFFQVCDQLCDLFVCHMPIIHNRPSYVYDGRLFHVDLLVVL